MEQLTEKEKTILADAIGDLYKEINVTKCPYENNESEPYLY